MPIKKVSRKNQQYLRETFCIIKAVLKQKFKTAFYMFILQGL